MPILGSIPIIGELFKTRSGAKEKRNLMLFIRPTIIRDGAQAAIETNAKYNVVRNQQLQRRKGKVTLLPGERQPLLPPIEELSRYADPTAGAKQPEPGTDPTKPAETAPLEELRRRSSSRSSRRRQQRTAARPAARSRSSHRIETEVV